MKILKVIRTLALGLLVLILGGVGLVYGITSYRLQRKHTVDATPVPVPSTAVAIERGRHLATTRGCVDCHGPDLAGAKVIEDAMAGHVHGPNLTRGVGGLPAEVSDVDYVRAIRHGVSREGRAYLLMPSHEYAALSDEDVGALIAYLKTVPPVDRPRGPVSPGPVVRVLMVLGQFKIAAEEIDHSVKHVASVTPAVSVDYGKYLATGCTGCHGMNLAGGKIPGAPPDWPLAANLTAHPSSRVAQWNETQFIAAIRTRQRPDGTTLSPVMPASFAAMTDLELGALWAYIRTLPSVATGGQ